MSREIKFRGKRIDNGEWAVGNLFVDPDTKHCMISGYDYYTDSEGLQREPFDWAVDPDSVGQYTGLRDKNGVEIYEGDIVKYSSREQTGTQVKYKRRGYDTYAVYSEIEIIGHVRQGLFDSSLNGKLMTYIVDTEQVTKYESYFWGEGRRTDRPKIVINSLVKALNANKEYEVIGSIYEHPLFIGGESDGN